MKSSALRALLSIVLFVAAARADYPERPMLSQKAIIVQRVGLTDITVTYHRPKVKGRKVWGELVPYDRVWRAGANEATTVNFTDDVVIEDHPLAAGTYSFFVIPTKTLWKVIFNTDTDQWGAFSMDTNRNALSLTVKPESVPHEEYLSYSFTDLEFTSAKMLLKWEKLGISLKIQVHTEATLALLDEEAITAAWQQLHNTAHTYYEQGIHWDKAMAAIDKSISIDENDGNLLTKAQLLAQGGRKSEAVRVAERAIHVGKEKNPTFDPGMLERLMKEWGKKD